MPPTKARRRTTRRIQQRNAGSKAFIEAAFTDDIVTLRDTKNPNRGVIVCTDVQWQTFQDSIKKQQSVDSDTSTGKVAERRKRSFKRRQPEDSHMRPCGKVQKMGGNPPLASNRPVVYRPRAKSAPAGPVDLLDRLFSRWTESDDYKRRYEEMTQATTSMILSIIRSVIRSIMIWMFGGCLILLAGVTAAVKYAGLPPWVAFSVATGGPTAFVLTAFKGIRYLKVGFGMLSGSRQDDVSPDETMQEPEDLRGGG